MGEPLSHPETGGGSAPAGAVRIKGIVLAGTYHWNASSFEGLLPRPLVPVAQTPLICYVLRWLREGGIYSSTICANSASRAVRSYLHDGRQLSVRLDYYEDWTPRGAAGCARDAGMSSDADTFVIADGTVIPAVKLDLLLDDHRSSKAAMTLVVHHDRRSKRPGDRPFSPGGIYVFDRRVFDFIAETGFQDIKENLIPQLYRAGERIVTHVAEGPCLRVLNAQTHLAVNQWMVARIAGQPSALEGWGKYSVSGQLVAHPTAWVDPSVRVVGPVLLGPSVRIGAGATLVGPTSIASGSKVGKGALVARSVIGNRCVIGEESLVDGCVLADEAVVEPETRLFKAAKGAPRRRLVRDVFGERSSRASPKTAGGSSPLGAPQGGVSLP